MRIKNKAYIIEINGEPVLGYNDFLSRSIRSSGISYSEFIIGLLCNFDSFYKYATTNKLLFQFVVKAKKNIEKKLINDSES